MILHEIHIKLGTHGVFYGVDINKYPDKAPHITYIDLDNKFPNFLKGVFNISPEDINRIDSYAKITQFLVKHELSQFAFFENPDKIRGDYRKKINSNGKLQDILLSLPKPTKTLDDFKALYIPIIIDKYPFIEYKKQDIINAQLREKEEARIRREQLQQLFNVSHL